MDPLDDNNQVPHVPPPKKEEEPGDSPSLIGRITGAIASVFTSSTSGPTPATPPASPPKDDYKQVIREWAERADGAWLKGDYKKAEAAFLKFLQNLPEPGRLPRPGGEYSIQLLSLNISSLPDIWHLPACQSRLKHLDLTGCTYITALPEGIGQLRELERLTLKGCTSLVTLPDMRHLEKLECLDLRDCKAFKGPIENLRAQCEVWGFNRS